MKDEAASNRRSPRLVPTAAVTVRLGETDLPISIHDLSLGGFAIVCPRPFSPGMTHRFTLAVPARQVELTIVAKAVHSRALPPNEPLRFLTGWEFMYARSERERVAIQQLLDAALGSSSSPLT